MYKRYITDRQRERQTDEGSNVTSSSNIRRTKGDFLNNTQKTIISYHMIW